MLPLVNIFTFFILTVWISFIISKLLRHYNQSIYFVSVVFYIFFVLPLLLDTIVSKPTYDFYPGFVKATDDELTGYIYCAYLLFIALVWSLISKLQKSKKTINENELNKLAIKLVTPLCYIGIISPLIFLALSPNPSFYKNYGAIIGVSTNSEVANYHSIINLSSILSVISVVVLLLIRKDYFVKLFIFSIPFIGFSLWVNGKRNIVALAIVLLLYAFWSNGLIKGEKLFFAGLVSVGILLAYSTLYQENLRYDQLHYSVDKVQAYENFRVDFGRDDVTKMTIYSELNPEEIKILEYRGQSFLFYLTLPIPRDYWIEKPFPYAVYFTSALFNLPPTLLGWGMTTSFLEETISNFGWFGVLVGPLLISSLCRIGDSYENVILKALTTLIASLLLVVELTAFIPLLYIWIFVLIGISILKKVSL